MLLLMKEKTLQQVLEEMKSRFTSSNGIPVERASIKFYEWQIVLAALNKLNGK